MMSDMLLSYRDNALDFYQQALLIFREVGARSGEATILNNISYIYFILLANYSLQH